MKINLGLIGFSWTPVHIELWSRWPKLPRVTLFYSMVNAAYFYGLTYRYNLVTWDKRTDRSGGWRQQEQVKSVPVLGTWENHSSRCHGHLLHIFGLRFKIDA